MRNPRCLTCPVRGHCEAAAAGVQERIPLPRKAKPTPLFRRYVLCIRDGRGRVLIEQRPSKGRWGGLWQFRTIDSPGGDGTYCDATLRAWLGFAVSEPVKLGHVKHALTHRRYAFDAYVAELTDKLRPAEQTWVTLAGLDRYPMSKPQLAIAGMLRRHAGGD